MSKHPIIISLTVLKQVEIEADDLEGAVENAKEILWRCDCPQIEELGYDFDDYHISLDYTKVEIKNDVERQND